MFDDFQEYPKWVGDTLVHDEPGENKAKATAAETDAKAEARARAESSMGSLRNAATEQAAADERKKDQQANAATAVTTPTESVPTIDLKPTTAPVGSKAGGKK